VRLEAIQAAPHPEGNRIDVAWRNPDPGAYPGVRLVRRAGTHPVAPDDGAVVWHGEFDDAEPDERGGTRHRVADRSLKSDTVYYYALFPFRGDPPDFAIERANRAVALATARQDAAGTMSELLPAIYRRYDAEHGLLRRLLELPSRELDLLQSLARSVLDAHDPDRVDGRLLPLLADWIGWKTDHGLEIEQQRNEIRGAPAIYQRVGLIPVIGATVKRIGGWESRSKEFVHNVARSNRPPRLNLWGRRLAADSTPLPPHGAAPNAAPDVLLSLDFAYEGRPAGALDDHGVRWLFYHTVRKNRSCLSYKTSPSFRLGTELRKALEAPEIPRLQRAFAAAGATLEADATVTAAGSLWHVAHAGGTQRFVVEPAGAGLTVYHVSAAPLGAAPHAPLLSPSFAPSALLNAEGGLDEKNPAVALQEETLWVFWSVQDPAARRWELRYRTRRDGGWTAVRDRLWEAEAEPVPERRSPVAAVDPAGGLWLFWLERDGLRWRLRYNRHDGSDLVTDPTAGWQLDPPGDFPADGAGDPRVEGDVFVLVEPTGGADGRVWLFWARREATAEPAQTRWSVAYRVKESLDPSLSDWGTIEALPKPDPVAHDREPAARLDEDGNLLLFWSSDRAGGWSVWRDTLDLAPAPPVWQSAERVTLSPYAQRDPLPVPLEGETLLLYRSSESLAYASEVYRATRTVDFRYAGSTTAHVREADRHALRGAFDDFHRYTFDTGTAADDWYRRDTIGVYVQPDTLDDLEVEQGIERLARVLPEFIPATDRAVLIPGRDLHVEHVYTYDLPGLEPRFIGESYTDALTLPQVEPVLEPDADFDDDLE
jgi:phage tail-like protein